LFQTSVGDDGEQYGGNRLPAGCELGVKHQYQVAPPPLRLLLLCLMRGKFHRSSQQTNMDSFFGISAQLSLPTIVVQLVVSSVDIRAVAESSSSVARDLAQRLVSDHVLKRTSVERVGLAVNEAGSIVLLCANSVAHASWLDTIDAQRPLLLTGLLFGGAF
jgi:hypothetical protein